MQIISILILALLVVCECAQKICFNEITNFDTSCEPDYYWRDFRGKIPGDAIEGGRTASGEPFYIAQAYIRNKELLPASVFPGKNEAVASAYNQVLTTSTHVKILCAQHEANFRWVPIESKNLNTLTNTHVVIGGSEVGQTLYIGRVFDDKSTVLGKIFKHTEPNRGLWVPSNGREANYLSYEILTYVCFNDTSFVNNPRMQ